MHKTSAKIGTGVDEAFLEMTKNLIKKENAMSADQKKKKQKGNQLGKNTPLTEVKTIEGRKKKGGCCK